MNLKKYLGEGFLIIFSVLFALFINRLAEEHKTNRASEIALESIKQELHRNSRVVDTWQVHHGKITERLTDIVEGKNDSLKIKLREKNYLDLALITENKSLIEAILSDTAWESAKATGIISEFDFETVQYLTRAYTMQSVLADRTLINILDYYFSADSHKMDNLDAVLIQFQLRFSELTGQEILMNQLYTEALEKLGH